MAIIGNTNTKNIFKVHYAMENLILHSGFHHFKVLGGDPNVVLFLVEYDQVVRLLPVAAQWQAKGGCSRFVTRDMQGVTPNDLPTMESLRHELLFDYLPNDLQLQTALRYDSLAENWASLLGLNDLIVEGVEITRLAKYHLLNSAIEAHAKMLLAVEKVIQCLAPGTIITDGILANYVKICLAKDGTPSESNIGERQRPRIYWLIQALMSLGFQLVFKPLAGHWKNKHQEPHRPKSTGGVCLGERSLLHNLHDILKDALIEDSPPYLLFTVPRPFIRQHKFSSMLEKQGRYWEGLCSLRDVVYVAIRSVKAYMKLFTRYTLPMPVIKGIGWRAQMAWPLYKSDVMRLVIQQLPQAIMACYLAKRILTKYKPRRLFVANPNSWALNVATAVFQKAGLPTASYAHGLVETALGYRGGQDVIFVPGDYDARLLSRFNGRSRYRAFGSYKVPLSPPGVRRNSLLLTSYVWAAGIKSRRSFLHETLTFIENWFDALAIEKVVVKLHPMEDHKEALRDFSGIKPKFPKLDGNLKVQSGDLEGAFRAAKIVFLMPSTTILDCFRHDLPFFLFDTGDFDRSTFYGSLPAEVVYSTAGELAKKFSIRLADKELNRKLERQYYGNHVDEGRSELFRFLTGDR